MNLTHASPVASFKAKGVSLLQGLATPFAKAKASAEGSMETAHTYGHFKVQKSLKSTEKRQDQEEKG